ncbi:MAG: hypothetical protein U5L73_02440 [Rhodoferax sp.]|uniref:hypothetical protein n=1 Tax=Rhodoferax sp. TaxID=50421 RepID=UPI002ACD6474|nr:hypothetical protein [Rhodoferax sp.]MDZ7890601.1 hypothetical protein [Rhodoferax sp.]
MSVSSITQEYATVNRITRKIQIGVPPMRELPTPPIDPEILKIAKAMSLAKTPAKKLELLNTLKELSGKLEQATQNAVAEARHKQVLAELKVTQIQTGQAIQAAYGEGYSAGSWPHTSGTSN